MEMVKERHSAYKPEGDCMCKSVEVLKNTECAYLEAVRVDSSRKFDGGGKREESDRKKKKRFFFRL